MKKQKLAVYYCFVQRAELSQLIQKFTAFTSYFHSKSLLFPASNLDQSKLDLSGHVTALNNVARIHLPKFKVRMRLAH